jgi:hypothetical protein
LLTKRTYDEQYVDEEVEASGKLLKMHYASLKPKKVEIAQSELTALINLRSDDSNGLAVCIATSTKKELHSKTSVDEYTVSGSYEYRF